MSMEEPRPEGPADVAGEMAKGAGSDPAAGIQGVPRKVHVLAFEPDRQRTGEWRARQFALNRFSPDRPGVSAPRLQLVTAPPRKSSPDERRSALPIRVPPHRPEDLSASVVREGRRVGVEIAPIEPFPDDRVRYFLTLAEQRREVPDRRTLWTLKEAAWKALGRNEPHPCTALELTFDDDGTLRGGVLAGTRFSAGGFAVSPWPDYILAVVWIDGDHP